MPTVFEQIRQVTKEEIDGQGHVNNVTYVQWMQDAAVAHSAAQGWDWPRYLSEDCAFVARSHFIEYLQPAFEDDFIVIRTWISDMEKITSRRRYRILRRSDETLLAVAETNWAFLSLSTRRPKRIPHELRDSFEIYHDPAGEQAS